MVADLDAKNNIELVNPIMDEQVITGISPTTNWWKRQTGTDNLYRAPVIFLGQSFRLAF